uniref:Neur_chan_LBD domain-containing protein n=1 Tax=Rhabditophanes sp. KR3021 TaxID=114890 RepID=A0AC35U184_9BILA
MSSSEIWIPEFSLYYSLNFNDAVKLLSNNDVRVNYTGHIRYYIPFSTESLCKLDVRFFPFDIQQCSLLLGSWAHSNDSIKYSLYSKNLSLIDFYDNQEWELDKVHSTVTADGFLYDYLDPPLFWEMIIIDLVMVRQSFYYVFNLVIPSTIITLVAVIGFHTPSTSGRVRDAKFRLGIMTLMSMSVILLAIVEDMPKFSMSSTRKGRGSFSGIPLIGLYYFILLAIIGLSTVTTSMFVFLEKDVRRKHVIPWYLVWLSFDIPAANQMHHRVLTEKRKDKLLRKELMVEDSQPQSSNEQRMFQNEGQLANNSKMKDCALSMVKIVNNGESSHDMPYQDSTTLFNESAISRDFASRQSSESRTNLKKRLNISTNDNLLSYQYFSTTLEEAMKVFESVETSVANIRKDMSQMIPQDDIHGKWQVVIRRLELISLMFYVSLLFSTMFLFFYHDWYCAVGNNPCGEQRNLKCKCGV